MSIESVILSNHLTLCYPFLLLPSIFPSIGSFRMSWFFASGDQSFTFSISPSNEYSGLISFRTTGLISLLFKRLSIVFFTPQFKSISSSALSLLLVQLSHPYMSTGKTIALTIQTFISKVMSLLLNVLSRFVIPRSKSFSFIAEVHSDFGDQEKKICPCFHFCPFIWHEVMGPDAMILVFWILSFKPAFHLPL